MEYAKIMDGLNRENRGVIFEGYKYILQKVSLIRINGFGDGEWLQLQGHIESYLKVQWHFKK